MATRGGKGRKARTAMYKTVERLRACYPTERHAPLASFASACGSVKRAGVIDDAGNVVDTDAAERAAAATVTAYKAACAFGPVVDDGTTDAGRRAVAIGRAVERLNTARTVDRGVRNARNAVAAAKREPAPVDPHADIKRAQAEDSLRRYLDREGVRTGKQHVRAFGPGERSNAAQEALWGESLPVKRAK